MATKHVIIGNGPAGMHAIETIRKYDPTGSDIHLVSSEPAYSRMVIPYWMAGSIDESHVLTATEAWYSKNRVTPHIGRQVHTRQFLVIGHQACSCALCRARRECSGPSSSSACCRRCDSIDANSSAEMSPVT